MNTIKWSMLGVMAGCMLLIGACADPCKDVVCENDGVCNEEGLCDCPEHFYGDQCQNECVHGTYSNGDCQCDEYYEGGICNTEEREKFYGTFDVVEECTVTDEYTSTISEGSGTINRITISNFYNRPANTVVATIDGTDLTIPEQEPESGFTVSGSGSISNDGSVITMIYTVNDSSFGTDQCEAVYTRQ